MMPASAAARARILIAACLAIVLTATLLAWKVGPASGSLISDEVLSNPAISGGPMLIGKRHIAVSGSLSAILYLGGDNDPWIYVRDAANGATSHVALPSGSSWSGVSYALRARDDLWVLSGTGPLELREYHLAGSPFPSSATLVSSKQVGDADSRPDDLLPLASGALLAVWHQQGSIGPQGVGVSYWSPWTLGWTTMYPITFMPTFASKFVAVQHPADGSIWVFGNPDSWGAIGAMHLTETATFVHLDWTDAQYISSADGAYDADPENPDLEVSPDPASGSVVLTYESIVRKMFSTSPVVTGSYVAVASIAADASKSFTSLDQYTERVSSLGLSVQSSTSWVAYRPIEPDLTFAKLYLTGDASGTWTTPVELGTLYSPYQQVLTDPGAPEFVTRLADGRVHIFRVASGPTPSPTPTDTASPAPTGSASPLPSPSPTVSASPEPAATPTATVSPVPTPTPTSVPHKCKGTRSQGCR